MTLAGEVVNFGGAVIGSTLACTHKPLNLVSFHFLWVRARGIAKGAT
jgi:hypothetical protein